MIQPEFFPVSDVPLDFQFVQGCYLGMPYKVLWDGELSGYVVRVKVSWRTWFCLPVYGSVYASLELALVAVKELVEWWLA